MTALKPIEARNVKGVSATKYKVNDVCAHPTCDKPRGDKGHHIFPRSQIGNAYYFVTVEDEETYTIPHVVGLCQEHHADVEAHRSWIKLEDDLFVWYDRNGEGWEQIEGTEWEEAGPLNPQPGVRVKSQKAISKKRERFKGEARRKRRTISYAVPQDEQEDGAGLIDDLLAQARERHGDVPDYYLYVRGLYLLITEGD